MEYYVVRGTNHDFPQILAQYLHVSAVLPYPGELWFPSFIRLETSVLELVNDVFDRTRSV
jgi:hypothetical protein